MIPPWHKAKTIFNQAKHHPAAIPFLISALVTAAVSAVASIAQGFLQAAFAKKPKPPTRDIRSQQNVTGTVENIPVVYGLARVGGINAYVDAKNAYNGSEATQIAGEWINQPTAGTYSYKTTVFCEGEIDNIEEVLIDGIPQTDENKFGDLYKVDLTLSWTFTEPTDPVNPTGNPVWGALYNSGQLGASPGNVFTYGGLYTGLTNGINPYNRNIDRYLLERRDINTGRTIEIGKYAKDTASIFLPNADFGHYEYILSYKLQNGTYIQVGYAEVIITNLDIDFVEVAKSNLDIVQQARQDGEYIRFEERLGLENQSAPQFMISEAPNYMSTMQGNQTAYICHRFLKHTKGTKAEKTPIKQIPTVTALIRGRKVYDPRNNSHIFTDDSTWEWTDNPAIILLDYLTNNRFGAKFDLDSIDINSFIEIANYCDDIVTENDGTQNKRYTFNGVLDTGTEVFNNIQGEILSAFDGYINVINGKWRVGARRITSPVLDLNADNILGEINLSQTGIRNKHNIVRAKWVNPDNNWSIDILEIRDQDSIDKDKKELIQEIDLLNVTSYYQAFRLASAFLKQSRLALRFSCKADPLVWEALTGDIVTVTLERYEYNQKPFRITSMNWNQSNTDLYVQVSLEEYADSIYDYSNLKVQLPAGVSTLNDFRNVPPPSALSVQQSFNTDITNSLVSQTIFSWLISDGNAVDKYQVELKPEGYGVWEVLGVTNAASLIVNDLAAGNYDLRVKAINTLGFESIYTNRKIEIFTRNDAPPNVENLRLEQSNNEVVLKWDRVPEVETSGFYRVRHIPSTDNTVEWTDDATFDILVSGKQNSVTLSQIDGTYMIKAVNTAGLQSQLADSIVLDLPDDSDWQIVESLIADPDFNGNKIQTAVDSNALILAGSILFDSIPGLFDSRPGLFLDNGGGTATLGSYDQDGVIDLGGVYRVKLRKIVQSNISQVGLNFDDHPGLFDSYQGQFDGSVPVNASVNYFFRTTRDDPNSASANWSNWELLRANEIASRAFQFRAELETDSINTRIRVEQLRANVYVKQRVEQGIATIDSPNKTILFNKEFYIPPSTVSANIQNPQAGDYVEISNITATSFNVTTRDINGNFSPRNISYLTQSLGERLA